MSQSGLFSVCFLRVCAQPAEARDPPALANAVGAPASYLSSLGHDCEALALGSSTSFVIGIGCSDEFLGFASCKLPVQERKCSRSQSQSCCNFATYISAIKQVSNRGDRFSLYYLDL
eukprot:scaffold1736_cov190-Alexandrium_tamarense.AAC.20